VPKDLLSELDLDHFRAQLSKYARRAFRSLPKLEKPRILDVGCGSGVPTIELAKLSDGEITAIDIDQNLLDTLNRKIKKEGFSNRVKARRCSLFELDFPDQNFDVIWAEGVISMIGFERGLSEWRRLLRDNGFLVVHDDVKDVSDKLKKIPNCGYRLLKYFSLPKEAWWKEYYRPLEIRIKELYVKYKNDASALEILGKQQKEIDMVKSNPEEYGSAFFVMQKSKERVSNRTTTNPAYTRKSNP
jgi:ubiquinone/menaquinone biosynthesis C-methylase UbiE